MLNVWTSALEVAGAWAGWLSHLGWSLQSFFLKLFKPPLSSLTEHFHQHFLSFKDDYFSREGQGALDSGHSDAAHLQWLSICCEGCHWTFSPQKSLGPGSPDWRLSLWKEIKLFFFFLSQRLQDMNVRSSAWCCPSSQALKMPVSFWICWMETDLSVQMMVLMLARQSSSRNPCHVHSSPGHQSAFWWCH